MPRSSRAQGPVRSPATAGRARSGPGRARTDPDVEERFLDSPRRLRYLIGGGGPPLLLCHGWLGSAENFETWFEGVGRRRTLVIPDLPACGDSAPLPGRAAPARALARRWTR